jgi:hypothetical protein
MKKGSLEYVCESDLETKAAESNQAKTPLVSEIENFCRGFVVPPLPPTIRTL